MLATFSVGALLAQQLISPVAIEHSIAMILGVHSFSQRHHMGALDSMRCQPADYKVVLPRRRHEMGLRKPGMDTITYHP